MKLLRFVRSPYTSLILNFAYALGNCSIGFITHSWWFVTVGAYYVVLTVTRYSVLLVKRKAGDKYTDMAKSKIVKANEKIAEAVTGGYKKIEKGVVGGYKKIEQGVVGGYTKIEDKFLEAYLTKDGETVEEAKARLKK